MGWLYKVTSTLDDDDTNSYFPLRLELEEWANNSDLDQLIISHTRSRLVQGSLQKSMIDLIFSNLVGLKVDLEFDNASNHYVLVVSFPYVIKPLPVKKLVTHLDWRFYSKTKMICSFSINFRGINAWDRDSYTINETAVCAKMVWQFN